MNSTTRRLKERTESPSTSKRLRNGKEGKQSRTKNGSVLKPSASRKRKSATGDSRSRGRRRSPCLKPLGSKKRRSERRELSGSNKRRKRSRSGKRSASGGRGIGN